MRRTKLVCTIGPASDSEEMIRKMITGGMNVARINFSHSDSDYHRQLIRRLKKVREELSAAVAILQDLGGIKLRLGHMDKQVQLNHGDVVTIGPEERSISQGRLPFPQPVILKNLRPGNLVFIADGTICLEVIENEDSEIKTRVRNGGIVSSYKGVNLPGVKFDMPVLTEDDKVALQFGLEQEVDWVAISFVRTVEDIRSAKAYMNNMGSKARIMAKLEKAEGIENLESILQEVDAVMVARGDLGVEIPMERVPLVQKEIVKKAGQAAKSSCIATQMLRTMVVSPTPTRAEVSDITNAVLDGCDSILLSDEIAVGQYPVEAVRVADVTIREAEKIYPYYQEFGRGDRTQAIAASAGRLVQEMNSKPIVLTSTGRAAFELSRFRPDADIIVFAHEEAVLRKLALAWGVYPVGVLPREPDIAQLVGMVIEGALNSGMVSETDVVTIVHGFLTGVSGTTNTIQVLDLQEYLARS